MSEKSPTLVDRLTSFGDCRFKDGAAYWGVACACGCGACYIFCGLLKPPSALRWVDVCCGNGASAYVSVIIVPPGWDIMGAIFRKPSEQSTP